jgi:hypothetical protein
MTDSKTQNTMTKPNNDDATEMVAESPEDDVMLELATDTPEADFLDKRIGELGDYARTRAENNHALRLGLVRVHDEYLNTYGTGKDRGQKRLTPEQSESFLTYCWSKLALSKSKVNRLLRGGRLVNELAHELEGERATAFKAAAVHLDDSALDELQKLRKQDRNLVSVDETGEVTVQFEDGPKRAADCTVETLQKLLRERRPTGENSKAAAKLIEDKGCGAKWNHTRDPHVRAVSGTLQHAENPDEKLTYTATNVRPNTVTIANGELVATPEDSSKAAYIICQSQDSENRVRRSDPGSKRWFWMQTS